MDIASESTPGRQSTPNDAISEEGLSGREAAERHARYGPNRLPEPPPPSVAVLFLRQFLNPFIYILAIAAVAALLVGQVASSVFIVSVLLINATIGSVQEFSAHRSAFALKRMVRGHTTVVRDGAPMRIDIEEVVPGDLVLLASGDRVPADMRLSATQSLAVDESLLTGESLAVGKSAEKHSAPEAPLSDRHDMAFAGSTVTGGRGRGVVETTGLSTEIGSIAKSLGQARLSEPPLMIRIRRFTWQVAAGIAVAIVALAGLMAGMGGYLPKEMAMMAIGLAVSTIPEGLPAALTVALAIGMRRMAAKNVVIRKLVAVEALGSCTFICSDKTGTLTVNELTVARAALPGGTTFEVTGAGVSPGGEVLGERTERLRTLAIAGVMANESHLDYSGGEWVSEGDIVDVAFLVFAKKLGLSLTALRAEQARLALIPYESERAFSASLNHRAGAAVLHAKGSPEKILALCSHMETSQGVVPIDRANLTAQFEALAAEGYRIIALARQDSMRAEPKVSEDMLGGMVFLGMVAMIDPVRPEAHAAIRRARAGGVEVAMITGDHPATARAIASDLGLMDQHGRVVTGGEIREYESRGEAELDALIQSARVFARIEPGQKATIVESFMRAGHFVAVTGDGVNDAPAMRRANAGVAMGRSGTDVARDAADLILTDDNFASIVAGIEQGRVVYNNIRKVVALLVATGFSALLLFFLTVLAGLPMPMTAVQLLWLNLVANGLQDVALAFEPKEGGELDRGPRAPDEPIFEAHVIRHVLIAGGVMGTLAFGLFAALSWTGTEPEAARNLTLMLMVLFGNLHALSSRSETRSVFALPLLRNPFLALAVPAAQLIHIAAMYVPGLSDVLEIAPISFVEWAGLLGLAAVLLAVEEVSKAADRKRARTSTLAP